MNFVSYVTGLLKLRGATDGTKIGNISDALKVSANITNAQLPLITPLEAANNIGNAYTVYDEYVVSSTTEDAFVLVTPNTSIRSYLSYRLRSSGEAGLEIYEAPTYTGTTAANLTNLNRNYADTADTTAIIPTTVTAAGTNISSNWFYSTKQVVSDTITSVDVVLKQDTAYLVRIESREPNCKIDLHIFWYEL